MTKIMFIMLASNLGLWLVFGLAVAYQYLFNKNLHESFKQQIILNENLLNIAANQVLVNNAQQVFNSKLIDNDVEVVVKHSSN